jgi:hypothetical protein
MTLSKWANGQLLLDKNRKRTLVLDLCLDNELRL